MKLVTPIYVRKKKAYFCPVCGNSITRRSKSHFLCQVRFDWTKTKAQGHKIDFFRHIRIPTLSTEAIAEATNYNYKHTQHALGAQVGMAPAIMDYLIDNIPAQVDELTRLRNRLIEIRKYGD